jgi:hypothetical protein
LNLDILLLVIGCGGRVGSMDGLGQLVKRIIVGDASPASHTNKHEYNKQNHLLDGLHAIRRENMLIVLLDAG